MAALSKLAQIKIASRIANGIPPQVPDAVKRMKDILEQADLDMLPPQVRAVHSNPALRNYLKSAGVIDQMTHVSYVSFCPGAYVRTTPEAALGAITILNTLRQQELDAVQQAKDLVLSAIHRCTTDWQVAQVMPWAVDVLSGLTSSRPKGTKLPSLEPNMELLEKLKDMGWRLDRAIARNPSRRKPDVSN